MIFILYFLILCSLSLILHSLCANEFQFFRRFRHTLFYTSYRLLCELAMLGRLAGIQSWSSPKYVDVKPLLPPSSSLSTTSKGNKKSGQKKNQASSKKKKGKALGTEWFDEGTPHKQPTKTEQKEHTTRNDFYLNYTKILLIH